MAFETEVDQKVELDDVVPCYGCESGDEHFLGRGVLAWLFEIMVRLVVCWESE